MTDAIKLPPPPEHGEYITIWERILEWDSERKAWAKALALSDKVDDEITATLQAYATAAIEQDRASAPPDGSWRQAIDEALIACALDCTSSRDDPKAALSKLIDWHVQVALDPAVSSAAQALIDADRAQRGEPVAWRAWFDKDSGARWLFLLWPDEENKGLEVDWQPLYTAPQPERKQVTCCAACGWESSFTSPTYYDQSLPRNQAMTTITIERSLLERLYLYWLEDADPHELDEFTAQVRAALSAPATAPEVTLQGQVSEPVIAPKDCLWSRNGHQCCPTSPQSSQPERKHTEAEVQALLDAGEKLATMRYSDGEFEQYVRRILGVPKP